MTTDLPTLASLWVGPRLGWIERMCLASAVRRGHRTVLFSYEPVQNLPEGVEPADAREVWTPPPRVQSATAPSYIADLFRIHLMTATEMAWIDTDIYVVDPLPLDDAGFLIGYTPWNAEVNNAIMRLPEGSATLARLLHFLADQSIIPPWIRPMLRQRLAAIPLEKREARRYRIKRTIAGPRALTYYLQETREVTHAHPPDVLSPVPWQNLEVLFDPEGGHQAWITPRTRAVHLWSNAIGARRAVPPHPESFVGRALAESGVGFD